MTSPAALAASARRMDPVAREPVPQTPSTRMAGPGIHERPPAVGGVLDEREVVRQGIGGESVVGRDRADQHRRAPAVATMSSIEASTASVSVTPVSLVPTITTSTSASTATMLSAMSRAVANPRA